MAGKRQDSKRLVMCMLYWAGFGWDYQTVQIPPGKKICRDSEATPRSRLGQGIFRGGEERGLGEGFMCLSEVSCTVGRLWLETYLWAADVGAGSRAGEVGRL